MDSFIVLISDFMASVLGVLYRVQFRLFNLNVNLLYLILGFIFISMAIGIFWKGAKG